MSQYRVTGAYGFFGGIFKRRLLREGHTVVNADLERDGSFLRHGWHEGKYPEVLLFWLANQRLTAHVVHNKHQASHWC